MGREIGPESLGIWREADEEHSVRGGPAAELAMGGAGELEVKNAAHAGADGGRIEGVAMIGEKDDAADAGGFGGAENCAEVSGGAQMLDDQPAQAVIRATVLQRPPVLIHNSAD